jgi:rRNA maturation protein Nop10
MPLTLKKCSKCNEYNLTDICRKCKSKTTDAHYKHIKIRDAPNSDGFFKDHTISNN